MWYKTRPFFKIVGSIFCMYLIGLVIAYYLSERASGFGKNVGILFGYIIYGIIIMWILIVATAGIAVWEKYGSKRKIN